MGGNFHVQKQASVNAQCCDRPRALRIARAVSTAGSGLRKYPSYRSDLSPIGQMLGAAAGSCSSCLSGDRPDGPPAGPCVARNIGNVNPQVDEHSLNPITPFRLGASQLYENSHRAIP